MHSPSGSPARTLPLPRSRARVRRTGVLAALAVVAATLVTLVSPSVASAATATLTGVVETTITEGAGVEDPPDDRLTLIEAKAESHVGQRGLVRWDLSSIPRGSTVTSATVTFTVGNTGPAVNAYALKRAFVDGQATWLLASTGVNWGAPGASDTTTDRDSAILGTIPATTVVGQTVDLSLDSDVVEGWIAEPGDNFGFVLQNTDDDDAVTLYSSERADEEQRPVLEVVYDAPAPVTVTTASPLAGGTVDAAYSASLAASGGTAPYTWSLTAGALPSGVTLSGNTISGTPTAAGTYNFTVRATDTYGATGDKAMQLTIDAAPAGGAFVGITPNRAFDSRDTTCVSGPAGREVVVAPTTGVPADAAAVALNVTVTESTANGYLTVYPTGDAQPESSNLNFARNQTVPNAVTSKVGTDGKITIYASGGCPNVIVDVVGYYTSGAPMPGGFVGITPNRAFDSRDTTCVSGPAGREVVVAPTTGVPADASGVVMNVTVTESTANGYLTVYPTGDAQPESSNLNFARNQTVPNAVTSKVGTDGKITIYASGGCPNVIVDVVGYYTSTS